MWCTYESGHTLCTSIQHLVSPDASWRSSASISVGLLLVPQISFWLRSFLVNIGMRLTFIVIITYIHCDNYFNNLPVQTELDRQVHEPLHVHDLLQQTPPPPPPQPLLLLPCLRRTALTPPPPLPQLPQPPASSCLSVTGTHKCRCPVSGADLVPDKDLENIIYMTLCMDEGTGHSLQVMLAKPLVLRYIGYSLPSPSQGYTLFAVSSPACLLLCTGPPACLPVFYSRSVCLSVCLPACLPARLSTRLSTRLSVCL